MLACKYLINLIKNLHSGQKKNITLLQSKHLIYQDFF